MRCWLRVFVEWVGSLQASKCPILKEVQTSYLNFGVAIAQANMPYRPCLVRALQSTLRILTAYLSTVNAL